MTIKEDAIASLASKTFSEDELLVMNYVAKQAVQEFCKQSCPFKEEVGTYAWKAVGVGIAIVGVGALALLKAMETYAK